MEEKQLTELYKFVRVDLSEKYEQKVDIEESEIVSGVFGQDKINKAIKITFIPEEATVENIEQKLATDLYKFGYNMDVPTFRNPSIERDVWLGKIRYKLVYVDGS